MPIIALLTDFGLRDTYVGQMHGVIAARDPSLRVIDVAHGIPPQNLLAGAFALADAAPAFPAGTIFVCVIDPGVGSARRAIAAEIGPWRFVGPDNGLLTVLSEQFPVGLVVELTNEAFHRWPRSSTFHGRDIFAPVATAWAMGISPSEFGRPITDEFVRLNNTHPVIERDEIRGTIVDADHYGNLRSNIRRSDIPAISNSMIGLDGEIIGRVLNCYADVSAGTALALFGSNDRLEVAVSRGSATERFPHAKTITVTFPD